MVFDAEDRGCEEAGIDGAGPTDREGSHRHAGGHLHDREERIHARQGLRPHRDPEHGERGLGGDHAGKVGGPSGAGHDDAYPSPGGGLGVFEEQVRGSVGAHDSGFVGHAQGFERLGRVSHGLPVTSGAHDHAHSRVADGITGVAHEPDGTDRRFPRGPFLRGDDPDRPRGH